jgi:hypothetical protein
VSGRHGLEVRREAFTTALYVSICLLAGLSATSDRDGHGQGRVLVIVWGTTIGLTLAHWVAFRASTRLVNEGRLGRSDAQHVAAQLAGASLVAAGCSVAVLVTPESAERDTVRFLLAAGIGAFGFVSARSVGATVRRAVIYATGLTAVAVVAAVVKNVLLGH